MKIGWLTATDERLLTYWPGALGHDDDSLNLLLESARVQCESYAPKLDSSNAVRMENEEGEERLEAPSHYLHAQALQARALSRAGIADGDSIGFGDHPVPVFPMDWAVQRLLRPQARPVVR